MGSFNSKSLDEETLRSTEPPVTPAAKRLLELDPRSPSVGITRTPIQVEATPKPIFDPRSPSAGIDRTPIFGKPVDSNSKIQESEPALAETNDPSEEILATSLPLLHSLPSLPELNLNDDSELMSRTLSEPELSKEDEAALNKYSRGPERQSFKESTPKKKTHRPNSFIPRPVQVLCTEPQIETQVKDAPRKVKDAPRSPLSVRTNVDVNSPRAIVQRKQVTKLGMTVGSKVGGSSKTFSPRSPSKYQPIKMTDKENLVDF